MTTLKYIYTEKGQQEAIIIPIDFWNDILKKFNIKESLKQEKFFLLKYSELLLNLYISENNKDTTEDIFSLFGSWQSEKTGDDLNNEIYQSRNDYPREIIL